MAINTRSSRKEKLVLLKKLEMLAHDYNDLSNTARSAIIVSLNFFNEHNPLKRKFIEYLKTHIKIKMRELNRYELVRNSRCIFELLEFECVFKYLPQLFMMTILDCCRLNKKISVVLYRLFSHWYDCCAKDGHSIYMFNRITDIYDQTRAGRNDFVFYQ